MFMTCGYSCTRTWFKSQVYGVEYYYAHFEKYIYKDFQWQKFNFYTHQLVGQGIEILAVIWSFEDDKTC